jgi:hypothetical protein
VAAKALDKLRTADMTAVECRDENNSTHAFPAEYPRLPETLCRGLNPRRIEIFNIYMLLNISIIRTLFHVGLRWQIQWLDCAEISSRD